ncbi:hypothetical protein YM304_10120 [Ilumatobacter coccineus YM16-304]|uniref:Uncharacterized protein n=1 Tax=Ilumatobacter coccineus (strain NBRC 103263 / KCTC 29153 / YM16-304) TaxID=1313172 RepID=A0A6C7EBD8_ILUCY|nr:hypothetical protein YM304_10120 [Ilumatobacter coccineus YM16-304]
MEQCCRSPRSRPKPPDEFCPGQKSPSRDHIEPGQKSPPRDHIEPGQKSPPRDHIEPGQKSPPRDHIEPGQKSPPRDDIEPGQKSSSRDDIEPGQKSSSGVSLAGHFMLPKHVEHADVTGVHQHETSGRQSRNPGPLACASDPGGSVAPGICMYSDSALRDLLEDYHRAQQSTTNRFRPGRCHCARRIDAWHSTRPGST